MNPPFRRNLLSASIEFICRYWWHHSIVENPKIGEAVKAAQAVVAGASK